MAAKQGSIITFSRRTDPAFFMDWFMDKIEKGGCYVPNPFSGKPYLVSLAPEDVMLLNFWTKNPGAILPHVETLMRKGYRLAWFISLTGYPRCLESAVPTPERSAGAIRELRALLGKEALWWRYDPIVVTRKLDVPWHIDNFSRLCEGVWAQNTERVIISLAHVDGAYSSIRPAIEASCAGNGDALTMPDYERFLELALCLAEVARSHGIELEVCCSPEIEEKDRALVRQGACLSMDYLKRLMPDMPRLKTKGTRKRSAEHGYAPCWCVESRDIGAGGTCAHGCVYCYANRRMKMVSPRSIDPSSPWLSSYSMPTSVEQEA